MRSSSERREVIGSGTLLLTRKQAAAQLGMSLRHFERHVQPQVPCIYTGQLRHYRPQDLDRWIDSRVSNAHAA